MMASLSDGSMQQRECVATVHRDGKPQDLYFLVHCSLIEVENTQYLLVFLQDVTISRNRAALEHLFFHDVKNMIGALSLNSKLLSSLKGEQDRQASQVRIQQIATYLDKEVEMQRVLMHDETQGYCLEATQVTVAEIVQEVIDLVKRHPSASGKQIQQSGSRCTARVMTDPSLLRRVLMNMLINAFEATRVNHDIKLAVEEQNEAVAFRVWNELPIPESLALRVFQRNFSTKEGSGRGLGTYTMKLFGETYLGGKVDFTSSTKDGTIFRFVLPKQR
jgi:signal transduction histidine kinase